MARPFTNQEIIAMCALGSDTAYRTRYIPFWELYRALPDMIEEQAMHCIRTLQIRYKHRDIFAIMLFAIKHGWVRVYTFVRDYITPTEEEYAKLHARADKYRFHIPSANVGYVRLKLRRSGIDLQK